MPFEQNQNQNRQQQAQVTTSLLSFWDENGNQLKISAMDSGLSIGIWVPQYDANGARKYPPTGRHNLILRLETVEALSRMIQEDILPAYMKGTPCGRGVFTNSARSNLLQVVNTEDGKFKVRIYNGCDATTHRASTSFEFTFSVYQAVGNYNSETGEIEALPIQADFYLFTKALSSYTLMVNGAISAHGDRYISRNRNTLLMDYLKNIATAVNAQLPASLSQMQGRTYNNYGGGGNDNLMSAPPATNSLEPAQTIEVDSFDALM